MILLKNPTVSLLLQGRWKFQFREIKINYRMNHVWFGNQELAIVFVTSLIGTLILVDTVENDCLVFKLLKFPFICLQSHLSTKIFGVTVQVPRKARTICRCALIRQNYAIIRFWKKWRLEWNVGMAFKIFFIIMHYCGK